MKAILSGLIALAGTTFFSGNKQLEQMSTAAQQEGKNIVIYFSGSDWCVHCHTFDKEVLRKDTIQFLLNRYYIQYTADFPQRKKLSAPEQKTNAALADQLNPDGVFPLLVITDEHFNVKKRLGKNAGLEQVVLELNEQAQH